MISKKSTFFLGIFIFLIPFMGLPNSWRAALIIISGLALISLSVKITIPKKTSRSRTRKEKVTPVFVESAPVTPVSPADNTFERTRDASVSSRTEIK